MAILAIRSTPVGREMLERKTGLETQRVPETDFSRAASGVQMGYGPMGVGSRAEDAGVSSES